MEARMNISLGKSWRPAVALGVLLALTAGLAGTGRTSVFAQGVAYKKVSGVSGNLSSVGSDTLNNVMTLWAETFRKFYPGVNVQVEGKGSGTAPPALTAGTSQLGPMSRTMRPTEEDAFEKKYGYKPTAIR